MTYRDDLWIYREPILFPAGTRRNNNVFITSKRRRRRRCDVMKRLSLRHYCAMCPLGYYGQNWYSASQSTGYGQPLLWRHNGRNGVSNYEPHHCLLNRLFLCEANSPVTDEFPASNAENSSIWWRHHDSTNSDHAGCPKYNECLLLANPWVTHKRFNPYICCPVCLLITVHRALRQSCMFNVAQRTWRWHWTCRQPTMKHHLINYVFCDTFLPRMRNINW